MLGKRSPQEKLFSCDNKHRKLVGERSFYCYLADHRHELFDDEDFAHLYCEDNGRESVPPSLLACALLLQWYNNVSDKEATEKAKFDLRWKVALGLEEGDVPFAKSTLWLFRTQLIVNEKLRFILEKSIQHSRLKGYFRSKNISIAADTSPLLGKGAVEDTYNLLAEAIRVILRTLSKFADESIELYATRHNFQRYIEPSVKGTFSIDWDNSDDRKTVLQTIVADSDRVLLLANQILSQYDPQSEEAQKILTDTELLRKILVQDVKRNESGTDAEIIQGVASERIISVHDPEMRHGRKSASHRFDGYKASIAVDTESKLITAVDVIPANAHDGSSTQTLIDDTEEITGTRIDEFIGDTAYGTVEQRLEHESAEDGSRTLIAPVPRPPQNNYYTKDDFTIDTDNNTVTCPHKQRTSKWYASKYKTKSGHTFNNKIFHFSESYCSSCPLRSRCIKPTSRYRTISVHEHEKLIQEAKIFQRTEEFKTQYRKRVVVEHRFARLMQLGARKARYIGSKKTLFQLAMTAAVANLTLIAAASPYYSNILRFVKIKFQFLLNYFFQYVYYVHSNKFLNSMRVIHVLK